MLDQNEGATCTSWLSPPPQMAAASADATSSEDAPVCKAPGAMPCSAGDAPSLAAGAVRASFSAPSQMPHAFTDTAIFLRVPITAAYHMHQAVNSMATKARALPHQSKFNLVPMAAASNADAGRKCPKGSISPFQTSQMSRRLVRHSL